jgi:small-conductance mechanosensitive channel
MALEAHLMIVLITGAILAVLLIVMILQARELVAAAILGAGSTPRQGDAAAPETGNADGLAPLRVQFAATWHVFAILYVIVIWLLWAMSMLARGSSTIWAATASVGVIMLFPILDRAFGRVLLDMLNGATGGAGRSGPNYAGVMRRGLRVVLVLGLGTVVLQLWGVNLSGEMGTQAQGALAEASFDVAVALLLAYLGWQLIKVGIDRQLVPREVNGVLVEPNARMKTLLPLARKFFVVVLVVMTLMLLLSALGVNIGPLLAGAGVVGIAIGFGAQTLVRDVMSGIFFLIEDAFRVGEYVEMGELRGEVEAISLRSLRLRHHRGPVHTSLRLRHHRGPVHTIPFGELRSITNHNRDWVIYKMSFRVPFNTDIDKVKTLMKQVGGGMMADPDLGPKLIEPLKSQGVTEIDDSAMIIRVKFMCLPREQFILRREAYKRIKAAFEANGIEFAHRKVEIHSATSTPASEPAQAGAAAAALAEGSSTA